MNEEQAQPLERPVAKLIMACIASTWFAISSNLCIYSDARIAMTVGDRHPAIWEIGALWCSILLQPWIILFLIIDSLIVGMSLTSTIIGVLVMAAVSAVLFYILISRYIERYATVTWVGIAFMTLLAFIDTQTFITDMNIVTRLDNHSLEHP